MLYRWESDEKTDGTLTDWISNFVQKRIFDHFNLKIKLVPLKDDWTDLEAYSRAPIFVSPDWYQNTKRALVLIQGMGEVRAGLWDKSATVSHSLEIGSMLPQIKFAVENDMAILIFNPNYEKDQNDKPIDSLVNSKERHWNYVFKKFIKRKSKAEEVFVIAHSYGGRCCAELVTRFTDEFQYRVKAIAFTDSSNCKIDTIDKEEEEWVKDHCKAYVASDKSLGKKVNKVQYISYKLNQLYLLVSIQDMLKY